MITDLIKYVNMEHLYRMCFVSRKNTAQVREFIFRSSIQAYMKHFGMLVGEPISRNIDYIIYDPKVSDDEIIASLDSFIRPDMEVPYCRPRVFVAIWRRYGDVFGDDDQILTYQAYLGVAELPDAMIMKYYSICAIAAAIIYIKFGRKLIHQVLNLDDIPESKDMVSDVTGSAERWIALVSRIPGFIDWYIANLSDDWHCCCIVGPTARMFSDVVNHDIFAFSSFRASLKIPEDPDDIVSLCSYDVICREIGRCKSFEPLCSNRLLTDMQRLDIYIRMGRKSYKYWDMVPGATFRDLSPEAITKLNVLPE